jgi:hypothetical protein
VLNVTACSLFGVFGEFVITQEYPSMQLTVYHPAMISFPHKKC